MRVRKVEPSQRIRILLTNGRFPVALDLARQLHKVGHTVYVVDPMQFHITKFSRSVRKSYKVPSPHEWAAGYIDFVRTAASELKIHLIIPMHEEIFYLAQVNDLRPILFAPTFHTLIALHNKWQFYKLVVSAGLSAPPTTLCTTMEDVRRLDLSKEYALKPAFGRALSGIHHLKPGEPLPERLDVSEDLPYIAQEWIAGKQLCSYGVARDGELKGCVIYPVVDTIDGSSCVFFQSVEHAGIKQFMEALSRTYNITGQLAFDFIETPEQLYAIECNPRATSGIHLFNKTPWLVDALTNPLATRHDAKIGKKMQMIPGMLMWEPRENTKHEKSQHRRRLFGTHDILFRMSDPFPAFMQPFLYATYVKKCHEKNLQLKELFQWDMIWEPSKEEQRRANEEAQMAGDHVSWALAGGQSAPPTPAFSPTTTSTPFQSTSGISQSPAGYLPFNTGQPAHQPLPNATSTQYTEYLPFNTVQPAPQPLPNATTTSIAFQPSQLVTPSLHNTIQPLPTNILLNENNAIPNTKQGVATAQPPVVGSSAL